MTFSVTHKRSYQAEEPQEFSNKVSRPKLFLKRRALLQDSPLLKSVKLCRKRMHAPLLATASHSNKRPRFFAPKRPLCPAVLKIITNLPPKPIPPTRPQPLPGNENISKPTPKPSARSATPAHDMDDITAKIAYLRINLR